MTLFRLVVDLSFTLYNCHNDLQKAVGLNEVIGSLTI